MNILGISAGFHDAAVTLLKDNEIVFAGHAERYSKRKNSKHINSELIEDALSYGQPDVLAYYERPLVKKIQQVYSGQYRAAFYQSFTLGQYLREHISGSVHIKSLLRCPRKYMSHHLSHAAAGFQTSPFEKATVVVIDAIGELDTVSIFGAEYVNGRAQYKLLWRQRYPHSIGLFYTAVTDRVGLRPNEDEYVLMGMAAYGKPTIANELKYHLVDHEYDIKFRQNFHAGIDLNFLDKIKEIKDEDLASSTQALTENLIYNIMRRAQKFDWSSNLVYMGGVALNCLANRNLGDYFEKIWILPNPSDAGSSLGAAALALGTRINWNSAYLGHCIPGAYPVNAALDALLNDGMVGVASGRAEFGPRALGNRSLLADPRGPDIKERVNEIKRRQQFRPFAPVILEELVHDYFDVPSGWSDTRYMQVVARCRRPDLFPAIVHADGTSRIQTVPKDGSGIRELLEKWYVVTDCPMLLNTSLNIRGEPMVNNRFDADRFELLYKVKVLS